MIQIKINWLLIQLLIEPEGVTYLTAVKILIKTKLDHQKCIRFEIFEVTVKPSSIGIFLQL